MCLKNSYSRENIEVSNEKNTDIIVISYSSPFADESALILNQMSIEEAEQYLEQISNDDAELYASIKKY